MKIEMDEVEIDSCTEMTSELSFQWKTSTHTKKRIWYKWLKHHIRQCMILEAVFFIIMILLLYNSFKIITQNEKNSEMITQLQAQIHSIEARFDSNIKQGFSAEEDQNFLEKNSEIPITSTTLSSPLTTVMTTEEPIITTNLPTATTYDPQEASEIKSHNPPEPFNRSLPHFNAASYLSGAFVSHYKSSQEVSHLGQSNYVILEREPIQNKSWCTKSKNPVLTIILAEKIRPVAVSYQHLKWKGIVPNGAPEIYDVKTCLDVNCTVVIPLAFKCEYKSSGEQEQFCSIEYNDDKLPLINRIQFHFHKNHGNVNVTCAYLVRVFGEGNRKVGKITPPEGHTKRCTSLIWHRKNNPFIYNNILVKNCKTLYENDCCAECPECCTECLISDWNYIEILKIAGLICVFVLALMLYGLVIKAKEREREQRRY